MSTVVVVSDSEIHGGTLVQWFGSYHEERDHRPFIEVSHLGMYVNGWFDRFPEGAVDTALQACHALKKRPKANMSHLATHHRVMGDLVPIEVPIESAPPKCTGCDNDAQDPDCPVHGTAVTG
jgi:hypothetical protein